MENCRSARVLAFMNAFTQGKSGGDVAFIEIFKLLNFSKLTVVTSLLGKKLCEASGLKAKFVVTTHEKEFGNVYYTYFKRIVNAIIYVFKRNDFYLVYSSSDALPDVLPAVLLKIVHKKIKWMVKSYHLIPKTRSLSYFFQRISLLAANRYADIVFNKGEFGFNNEMIDSVLPSPQKFDAVFMSRLHASKGIFDLIEVWKKIVIKLPNATLAVIGLGSKKIVTKLCKIIKDNNLNDNVTLFGFLDDKKAYSLVKSAKLFLFPSHEEAFAIVLGEVMLCRAPIVVYSLPTFKWCNEYVFKAPCFEKEYFEGLICALLNNKKKRMTHVEEAYEFAKSFTWEKAAEYELTKIKQLM